MTPEDNERHFKAWLDKNSWRRDLQRLEKEYGGGAPKGSGTRSFVDLDPKGHEKHCTPMGDKSSRQPSPLARPFTDEFHFDAMSVISYLGEALKYRSILRLCPRCSAPVRTHAGELPHLCTVCAELRS